MITFWAPKSNIFILLGPPSLQGVITSSESHPHLFKLECNVPRSEMIWSRGCRDRWPNETLICLPGGMLGRKQCDGGAEGPDEHVTCYICFA
jgi:hypothetical protein